MLLAVLQVREAEKRNLSLADYLAGPKQRMVLILGDYSAEGERRLRMIAEILQDLGYDPVLVKDIPEHPQYDLQQKVVAVGSVSRFVVVDDSSRSGHILEIGRVHDNRWVAIVMRLEGSHGTFMTQGLGITSRVIREESYTPATLRPVLQDAATWAEERVAELQRSYAEVYPWRGSDESHSP